MAMAVISSDIEHFVADVADRCRFQLGPILTEAYKLGSLAHGGFSEIYSDIDVGLLLNCREPPSEMADMIVNVKSSNGEYGKKLSVFWGNPDFAWGRLPIIDQIDLLDHGVPLLHGFKGEFRRPTKEEIHREQLESLERSWRSRLPGLSRLTMLEAKDHKPYIRAILYAARLIYTWDNLAVASNDSAVDYLHKIEPPGLDLNLIDLALACRNGMCAIEDVFAAGGDLNQQCQSAVRYISSRS